jgi:hypothetical protein
MLKFLAGLILGIFESLTATSWAAGVFGSGTLSGPPNRGHNWTEKFSGGASIESKAGGGGPPAIGRLFLVGMRGGAAFCFAQMWVGASAMAEHSGLSREFNTLNFFEKPRPIVMARLLGRLELFPLPERRRVAYQLHLPSTAGW